MSSRLARAAASPAFPVVRRGPIAYLEDMPVGTTRHQHGPGRDDPNNTGVEMAWIYLIIAGLLEVAWSSGLKLVADRFSLPMAALTLVAMIASVVALGLAMTRLPLGIAYPIWTGIGSVGAVAIGTLVFGHGLSVGGMIGLVLLIAGMALLGAEAH